MRALLTLLAAASIGISSGAPAMDNWQNLNLAAVEAKRARATIEHPWISHMRVDIDQTDIREADGTTLMRAPRVGYFNDRAYDIERFYEAEEPRLNAMFRYAGRRPGEIFSVGVDTGFAAEKVRVQPALFLGYTRALRFSTNSHIALSAGAWLGGRTQFKPCVDSANKHYLCGARISFWSDFRQPEHSTDIHRSLLWIYEF